MTKRRRASLAHYGLGQYLAAEDIVHDDPLKGLTLKAFGKDYDATKTEIYTLLRNLAQQIANHVLKVQA